MDVIGGNSSAPLVALRHYPTGCLLKNSIQTITNACCKNTYAVLDVDRRERAH